MHKENVMSALCPCGVLEGFENCCALLLSGTQFPETAEALMRSRYTAYTMGNGHYLVDTTAPQNRCESDVTLIEEHALATEWLKLEVISTAESGDRASVEFKAYSRYGEKLQVHHEKSRFERIDGRWYYVDGQLYEAQVGRNEPCPCGSGKKYKKCCAQG